MYFYYNTPRVLIYFNTDELKTLDKNLYVSEFNNQISLSQSIWDKNTLNNYVNNIWLTR